jgi:hypothetical protein
VLVLLLPQAFQGVSCETGLYVSLKARQALELLLQYFVASEVGIANYIQRVSPSRSGLALLTLTPVALRLGQQHCVLG